MLKRIIAFSAANRGLVVGCIAGLLIAAVWCMKHIPLDALPELSDTQVIVYSRWDRSPDIVEDQVTYPIVTALLGAPKVRAIRGFTDFGYSFVYVVFEDGTDLYWARSRVLEYMSKLSSQLPPGVKTELGPDASSLGWVFQYALVDKSGAHSTDELRTYQDWFLRYELQAVPGVAQVATVGGQVRQYQVTVNPNTLASYGLSFEAVVSAVRRGNSEVGGRLLEIGGREYMVRGRGYLTSIADLEEAVIRTVNGTPVRLGDVARVALGPDIRRGVADLDGEGDVVGGITIMRQGENALAVIDRVKARLVELKASLPKGVEVVTTYDRSDLIERAIDNVKHRIIEEIIIVSLIILLFLWHVPSAVVPILTIPASVALAFIPMYLLGINANLMSLSGIAISIGVLVDGAIVEVENAYNAIYKWQQAGRHGDFRAVRLHALMEVGPSVFFSLLVIAIAFLPIFVLIDQEGRLFHPLAYSKTLAMAIAAFLALTLDPALRMLFARERPFSFRPTLLARAASSVLVGTYVSEERHPVSRLLHRIYEGPCRWVLDHPKLVIAASAALVVTAVPAYLHLGSEFMPPLQEGSLLYMPSAVQPGMSVGEAQRVLQVQDKILRSFPEVDRVFGKAGRADTPTDPAPLSMMETTILLKPEHAWRPVDRWYSGIAPDWLKPALRSLWRDRITQDQLITEMDQKLRLPGISNAWTMPIKARIDMLSTGIRTPVGLKISGPDLAVIEDIGLKLEGALGSVPGTRSVLAERARGGSYLDYELNRRELARYGLTVDDANQMVLTAVGGDTQTVTVEGRQRYSVNVRYARDYRDDLQSLGRVLLPLPDGKGQIPMSAIAELKLRDGPPMIRDENGQLTAYVYVDFDAALYDIGTYVDAAKLVVQGVSIPPGYAVRWSGQYENMIRVKERLLIVVPLTLALIYLLLYLNTRSSFKAALVMLAVPFSAVGAIWLLWALGYHMSIAVWVGLIALMGLDAETGVFMLLFLDLSHDEAVTAGRMRDERDLKEAIIHGAVKRVRPKAMTVFASMLGLLPIMWATGAGSDLMKRIAAPMVGGLGTSFLLELLVYPAVYFLWKRRGLSFAQTAAAQ